MIHAKSDSDMTSLSPSSPRSPKRAVYYVQSPSRDSSQDGDGAEKSTTLSSSMQAFNSPMESPSHPSSGRHSRTSSASRFSGNLRRKRNDKGWPECHVIEEEGNYDELLDKGLARRCQIVMAFVGFVLVFTVFCLILWGASRPFKAKITLKALTVHNFYFGEGSDMTGVPTKLLTVNCSVRMSVYNPATFFGIHVSSSPFNLMYSEISVAKGQMKKYYQPRKSHRTVIVNLRGVKVPLYGAGGSLVSSDSDREIPMTLVSEVRSKGLVMGKLVRTTHRRHISCSLTIDSHVTKPVKFKHDACLIK